MLILLPRSLRRCTRAGALLIAVASAAPLAMAAEASLFDWPAATPSATAPRLSLELQEWSFDPTQASGGAASGNATATVGSAVADTGQLGQGRLGWDSRKAPARVQRAAADGTARALELTWAEAGLRADLQAVPLAGGLRVSGLLHNLRVDTATTRRLTIQLLVRTDGLRQHGTWLQDARTTRPLATGEEQYYSFGSRAGARGSISRYPFGAVALAGQGYAVGMPLDRPCVQRIRYEPADEALIAELDVALTPLPLKFPNAAPFDFVIYGFDGNDGFRGALQGYYAMHGDMFRARTPRQGLWMPFTQVDNVRRPEDFRFAYHEYHPNVSTAYNGRNGILSLIYCEPPVQYIDLPAGTPRTMEAFHATLATLQTDRAKVVRTSGATGGRAEPDLITRFVVAPWADGARVSTNCDPEVARTAADPLNAYDLNWMPYAEQMRLLQADARRATTMPCDGLYLDSLEGWESPYLNHRREHLALTDWPLTFDAATGEVGQVLLLQNMEFVREAADRLRRRGHYLMANTALYRWCWPAAWLDVMGIETNWGAGEELTPPPLSELDFIRAMCGERPYCYLQNVDFASFRGEKVRQYFARSLFHGMWPGFFSADAASHPYWENAAYYDADRPLFLHYLQPLGKLTESGWRPLTRATSSEADVLLERWGGVDDPRTSTTRTAFHLSVLNTATAPRRPIIALDAAWGFTAPPVVFELLNGYRVPVQSRLVEGRACLQLDLPPGESAALLIVPREAQAIEAERALQFALVAELVDKWQRHGLLKAPAAQALLTGDLAALDQLARIAPQLGAPYTAEAQRAERLARGLVALQSEQRAKVAAELELAGLLVPDQPNHFALHGLPDGSQVRVDWATDDAAGSSTQPAESIELRLPKGARPGDPLQLRVRSADGGALALDYQTSWHLHPTLELLAEPSPLRVTTTGTLEVQLANHASEAIAGELTLTGAASEPAPPLALQLPAAAATRQAFTIRSARAVAQDERATITLRFTPAGGAAATERRLPVTWLRTGWSALRDSAVRVQVDSTYSGYTPRPITDGTTDTTQVNWSDAAWASDEGLLAHWAEFTFPQPRTLSRVRIWWAHDADHYQTSADVRIEAASAAGAAWERLTHHKPAVVEEVPVSEFRFAPQPVQRLRVYQPAGGGPPARAGIFWLAEVEAE